MARVYRLADQLVAGDVLLLENGVEDTVRSTQLVSAANGVVVLVQLTSGQDRSYLSGTHVIAVSD